MIFLVNVKISNVAYGLDIFFAIRTFNSSAIGICGGFIAIFSVNCVPVRGIFLNEDGRTLGVNLLIRMIFWFRKGVEFIFSKISFFSSVELDAVSVDAF